MSANFYSNMMLLRCFLYFAKVLIYIRLESKKINTQTGLLFQIVEKHYLDYTAREFQMTQFFSSNVVLNGNNISCKYAYLL